jgi:uncharacterized protein (DUF2236 family)
MSLIELAPIRPPRALQSLAATALHDLMAVDGRPPADFSQPAGEAALVPPQSVSWRVFKNPVALFTGGVAAVILELAEPRVRAGVWDFTSFRSDPVTRLRRTGLAAMITVYGARANAESMIAGVRRMHKRVKGETDAGESYRADDPQLLNWVQATAAFGFLQAYHRYVQELAREARDRYYGEGTEAAALYGADDVPRTEAELQAFFLAMEPRLQRSDAIFEFLNIMREAPVFPARLRPAQRLLVRAAVDLVPPAIRHKLGLDHDGLRVGEHALVKLAGRLADHVVLEASPAVQACQRMGLPEDYLYRRKRA